MLPHLVLYVLLQLLRLGHLLCLLCTCVVPDAALVLPLLLFLLLCLLLYLLLLRAV